MQYSCRGFHGTGSFSGVNGGGEAGEGQPGAWARNPEERKGRQDSMRQVEESPARDGRRSGKAPRRMAEGAEALRRMAEGAEALRRMAEGAEKPCVGWPKERESPGKGQGRDGT